MDVISPTVPLLSQSEPTQDGPVRPGEQSLNRGQFRPGNMAGFKHGGRSARVQAGLMPEQAEARAALRERVAAIVADLGGTDTLSALAVGQVQRHARLELVDGYLWENLQRHGPLTGKGATRAALTAWLSVVDRLQKSATTLGLSRRSKDISDCSPEQWIASEQARERAGQGVTGDTTDPVDDSQQGD